MRNLIKVLTGFLCIAALSGCATAAKRVAGSAGMMMPAPAVSDTMEVQAGRMLIWKSQLNIEVWNVSNAVCEATAMVEHQGGFVEQKSDQGAESASLTLRVPAKIHKTALASLETLGTVMFRRVEGEDVTEQYIDVEARLSNKIVLRDRLKQLLDKATDVKDVLAIETELNRVQGDIDSMEGRIKSLKGQVEYATIVLYLERKTILGPLGYLFHGLWWGVEKLFVIRE